MKKNQLLFSTAIAGTIALGLQCVNAQETYLNVGLGYGMNAASQTMPYSASLSSDTIASIKGVHGSLGKGLNFGVSFGYMFNKNVGAELGVNYLKGSPIKSKFTDYTYIYTNLQTLTTNANMLRIIPTIVITTSDGTLRPYAKVGLVMGVMGKATTIYTDDIGSYAYEETREASGGIAIGFASNLGLKIEAANMSLFAELAMINQSWAPTKNIMTESKFKGVDQLGSMTTYQKETNYVDSYTETTTPDQNSPRQNTKQYLPMSSFGINIGIRIPLEKYLNRKKVIQ